MTKCNFAGDGKTGASWTDNIMAQKSSEGAASETREQGDGVADEEWVGPGRRLWAWRWCGLSPGGSFVWTSCSWVVAERDSNLTLLPALVDFLSVSLMKSPSRHEGTFLPGGPELCQSTREPHKFIKVKDRKKGAQRGTKET